MALMDGYNDPTEAEVSRIMFFTPNGTMLPVDQVSLSTDETIMRMRLSLASFFRLIILYHKFHIRAERASICISQGIR